MPNVKEIITDHLISIGADGLCGKDCGCRIGNLFPEESCDGTCVPAEEVTQNCAECGNECSAAGEGETCLKPMEGK